MKIETKGKTPMHILLDYLGETTNLFIDHGTTAQFLDLEKKALIEASNTELKNDGWESGEIFYNENYPLTNNLTTPTP